MEFNVCAQVDTIEILAFLYFVNTHLNLFACLLNKCSTHCEVLVVDFKLCWIFLYDTYK